MAQIKDAALAHELKRWMRPDAHRFVRPDWRRFVRPGFEKDHPFNLYERKYREDQLRDDAAGGRMREVRVSQHQVPVQDAKQRSSALRVGVPRHLVAAQQEVKQPGSSLQRHKHERLLPACESLIRPGGQRRAFVKQLRVK
jgi:hypothetical protein